MSERPYTVLSCGVSIDGYLDDASRDRLVLSNAADLDRVDAERSASDAILVGAATVRNDNPRLLVRDAARRRRRVAAGRSATPTKVTITAGGRLDACSRFFTAGETQKIVYCASDAVAHARARFGSLATVVDGGEPVDLRRVVADLGNRGVRRLMVEGGGCVHTQLLTADLADELQLVVAPIFVGDSRAVRLVGDGSYPFHADRRARLAEVRQLGDVVLLRYALSDRFCGQEAVS